MLTNPQVPTPIKEASDEDGDGKGKANESVRVSYLDPDQAAEQRRLLKLLSPSQESLKTAGQKHGTTERKRRGGKTGDNALRGPQRKIYPRSNNYLPINKS